MKKLILFSVALFVSLNCFSQGVSINTTNAAPDGSAMLDISSDSLGVLIPRMTLSQREAILSPASGLLIYQTNNTPGFYYYSGSTWYRLGGSGVSLEDGKILIGNANNQAAEENISGDAWISNTGELSIAPAVITSAHIVDGTIVGSDINSTAGIQATSIAGASVDNTEYAYLDGATGNIQSQIDNNTAIFGTAGTVEPSKSVVVDANRDISNFNNVQANGTLTSGNSIVIDGTGTTEGAITESHGRLSFGNDTLYTTGVIGIGTSSPSKSAALDISSTNSGILIPRMTRGQRNLITNPAQGLMVYQTDNTPGFYHYDGTSWKLVGAETFSIDDLFDGRTAGNNVFLGLGAGANDDSSNNQNVAVGRRALYKNLSGYYNTAIGYYALDSNTTGFQNTIIGYRASTFNSIGGKNTIMGNGANYFNEEGENNTILGFQAGKGTSPHSKSGNVFLGYQAGYNETTDNKLYIENSDSSNPLIYGDFANDIIGLNAKVGIGTHTPSVKLEVADTIYSSIGGYKFPDGTIQSTAADTNFIKEVIGGDNINVTEVNGIATVDHDDVSTQASVNNAGGMVIQDILLESMGHVTGISSVNLDTRYLQYIGNWFQLDGYYIGTDRVRARDLDGLKLYNDNDYGIFIHDNDKIGIGTSTPGAELEVNGQVKITGGTPGAGKVLTSDANGLASWQQSSDIPSGVIVMWSGLLVNIPSGWVLCDGTGGTPDLRDRFIYGVSNGENPGATGGSVQHDHTVDPPSTASGTENQSYVVVSNSTVNLAAAPRDHTHTVDIGPFQSGNAMALPPYIKMAYIMKL